VLEHLAEAKHHLAAGEPGAALAPLLAAWQPRRAPALSELIDRISRRFVTPLPGRTVKARLQAWREVEQRAQRTELGSLLAALGEGPGNERRRQLERLLEWPPDPRIGRAMIALLLSGEATFGRLYPVYVQAARVLERHFDPGTRESLREVRVQVRTVTDTIARLVQVPIPELAAAEHAAIAELATLATSLEEPPPPRTEEDLLGEIYARPDDLGARHVYADLLLERGDPRGELIQLQLLPARDAAQTRRVSALLRAHQGKWYGTLAPVVADGELTAGFLSSIRLRPSSDGQVIQLAGDRAWKLVDELDVGDLHESVQPRVIVPHLTRLRGLHGVRAAPLIELLARREPWQLERLGCFLNSANELIARAPLCAAAKQLPKLRQLCLGGSPRPGEQQWLVEHPLARQLRSLTLPFGMRAANWVSDLYDATWLDELCVREDADCDTRVSGWRYVFERGVGGTWSVLTATHEPGRTHRSGPPLVRLATDLQKFSQDAFTRIKIAPSRALQPKEGRDALDAVVARQTRLEVFSI
jgi:uncharacterized protein (TIGR02996 family)